MEDRTMVSYSVVGLLVLGLLTAVGMWGCPQYNVYQQQLAGEAELKRAEQNRQIAIQEARAKLESAKMLGDAEVERAKGVSEANRIIGDSLRGNEGYLRYLWIQGLQTNQMQVVYVPTEAGLPILEAGAGRLSGAHERTEAKK
jgi:regulator of protease activity HflC (stomatin/prohibitin superfamily)